MPISSFWLEPVQVSNFRCIVFQCFIPFCVEFELSIRANYFSWNWESDVKHLWSSKNSLGIDNVLKLHCGVFFASLTNNKKIEQINWRLIKLMKSNPVQNGIRFLTLPVFSNWRFPKYYAPSNKNPAKYYLSIFENISSIISLNSLSHFSEPFAQPSPFLKLSISSQQIGIFFVKCF